MVDFGLSLIGIGTPSSVSECGIGAAGSGKLHVPSDSVCRATVSGALGEGAAPTVSLRATGFWLVTWLTASGRFGLRERPDGEFRPISYFQLPKDMIEVLFDGPLGEV